jgi:tRNA threonylcarbamoyladenosine biosynthesis protein TsaE
MPVMDSQSLEFISRSVEQTRRAGIRLGSILTIGDIVCLVGELGSGKTTLVQGIASGWGSLDPATSPTFVLINVYRRSDRKRLFHLDAYRLNNTAEVQDLDIDALIEVGPLVVEWADRIPEALPKDRLWVTLHWIDENQRDLMFTAYGHRHKTIMLDLRRQIYGIS